MTAQPQRQWRPTGVGQEITGRVDRVPPFDERAGDHLWIWSAVFRTNPGRLSDPEYTPMLDSETLLTIAGPGCWYCEQPYSARLAARRCKGHP